MPDRRHQVLSHGRFLQISLAQVSDTGRYSCQASNSAGDRSRHFNLNVLGINMTFYNPLNPLISGSYQPVWDEFTLCSLPILGSFSLYCWFRSWRFCRGGDSNSEQPHLSGMWSPILPSCSHHLAQGWHSIWVQSQRPSPSRFEMHITPESSWLEYGMYICSHSTLMLSQVAGHFRFSMLKRRMQGDIPVWLLMRPERRWSTMKSRFMVRCLHLCKHSVSFLARKEKES